MKQERADYLIMVGKRVAATREKLNMTQAQLAEKANLSTSFISDIETGLKSLRAENLRNLAQALEVSADYLLTGEYNEKDVSQTSEIIRQFKTEELFCAQEILRKLLEICKHTEREDK